MRYSKASSTRGRRGTGRRCRPPNLRGGRHSLVSVERLVGLGGCRVDRVDLIGKVGKDSTACGVGRRGQQDRRERQRVRLL